MNCNIARDLFPLYLDGLCSDETKRQLEEHIENCKNCRQLKQSLETGPDDIREKGEWEKTIAPLKKVKKKMLRKNLLIIACVAVLILFTVVALFLTYGQLAKKGVSFEMLYDAMRLQNIGKEFADGNIDPLYEILEDGYSLHNEESCIVRLAYPDRDGYEADMKKVISEKYQQYFGGKELTFKGIEKIGYEATARMGWNRTLFVSLKFEGNENIEYYIGLYKTLNGQYLAHDYFGNPYMSYVENPQTGEEEAYKMETGAAEPYHTEDTLFSCLSNSLTDIDLSLMRQIAILSGQRALQGDRTLAENGQMRLNIISEQDLMNGTFDLLEYANKELDRISESGYYVTDVMCNVKAYDRTRHLYRYLVNLELTKDTSLEEILVTFECYRIADKFLYIEGTEEVYRQDTGQ